MTLIQKSKLTPGLYVVEIKEADLKICCGCPPDAIKFLKKAGHFGKSDLSSSPNAILLSDSKVQKGRITNFAEFVVMDMLYNQGMIKNAGSGADLPIIMGLKENIEHQVKYLCRGNYGFYSKKEILDYGLDKELADKLMSIKLYFSDGKIHAFDELSLSLPIGHEKIEIKNGVFISRKGFDQFFIEYKEESCTIDFNISSERELPFELPDSVFQYQGFSVLHSGEGNGWEINNPCMGSLIMYNGKIFAVDTGPGFLDIINRLGLDVQDLEGVFLTHVHDDHFAGLADLAKSSKRLKFYSSKLVRITIQNKLSELLGIDEKAFEYIFETSDLELDAWNDINGLQVMPCLSPHPVETNTFIFKSLNEKGEEKFYAHLADTISISDLVNFQTEKFGYALSDNDLQNIVSNYHCKVDVKKVDVGGGLIHGEKSDYQDDQSAKIVFSHNKYPSVKENNIEKERSSFGEQDVLIEGDHEDFLRDIFFQVLRRNFHLTDKNASYDLFAKSQKKLLKRGEQVKIGKGQVYFILNGNLVEPNVSFEQRILFDREHILGLKEFFDHSHEIFEVNTSFINLVVCKKEDFLTIVNQLEFWQKLLEKRAIIRALSGSALFRHFFCSGIIFNLAQNVEEVIFEEETLLNDVELSDLYVFESGEVQCKYFSQTICEFKRGDFFGGNKIIKYHDANIGFNVKPGSKFYRVPAEAFECVPLVLWMIYENHTRFDHLYKTSHFPIQVELTEALKKSELFRVLDEDSLKNVSGMVHQLKVSAGGVIVREGEPSDTLFLIVNGIGVVKKGLANEPEKILAYLMPGNTFGEVGILENKPRSATVSALTDMELIEIPSQLFEDLLMKFPRLGIELSKLLGYYLTQTNNRLTRGNKENRLIAIFNFGKPLSGNTFGKSISERIYEQSGHPTIFIHHTTVAKTKNLTNQFKIDQIAHSFHQLLNWDELNFPVGSRISMIADRLLNNYDNLVVYFEKKPEENLSIIYENLNQAIIISDKANYSRALEWRDSIQAQVSQRNVEFFTMIEEKGEKEPAKIIYKFPERTVSADGYLDLPSAVNLIADRLERNNRIGIFIPTTIDVNRAADTSDIVSDALNFLGKTFGGATSEEAIGVWNSKDIGIVDEKVFIVHSYTTAKALKENLDVVVDFVKNMKQKLRQESMALEINKRLTLI